MDKRGLSMVISAVILIALVVVSVGTIWVFVKNMIEESIEETEACFGIFEKVTIKNQYTCYNSSSGEFQFSISIGDIDVDKILVLISTISDSQNVEMYGGATYPYLKDYNGTYNDPIKFPEKNSGLTYVVSGFSDKVNLIEIAPVIDEKTCDISDSLYEIDDCLSLA